MEGSRTAGERVDDPPARTDQVLDVPVEDGPAPARWPGATEGPGGCVDPARVLHETDSFRIYVADGRRIIMESPTPALRTSFDFMVYGWALRWLLLQRSRFCLRATLVVSPGGRRVALVGPSHVGKSTTAIELRTRGWRLGGDDAVEVSATDGGLVAQAHPRPFHLSREEISRIGGGPGVGRPVPGSSRFAVMLPVELEPGPLDAVVHLAVSADVDADPHAITAVALAPTSSLARLSMLSWPESAAMVNAQRGRLLRWSTQVVEGAPGFTVTRPASGDSVLAVADAVEALDARGPKARARW